MIILRKLLRMDWILFGFLAFLCTMSVLVIYSATYTSEDPGLRDAYVQQMYWIPIGMVAYFLAALVDYKWWVRAAPYFFAIMLVMLVAVLLFGVVVNGARSWFRFGSIGVQPAEIYKLAFILMTAAVLNWRRKYIKSFLTFIIIVLMTALPALLVLAQPDFGSAAVLFPIAAVMMFVAGVRLFYLFVPTMAVCLLMAWSYFGVYKQNFTQEDPLAFKLKDYQLSRIKTFYNPNLDPKGAGWTINQSLIAIGSGGWDGKGWLNGTQNVLGYLPKNIAYNDFIFSVIGEERGFVGGATVIILEGLILLAALRVSWCARDGTGSLIAAGVMAMLFTHIFVNIGMTIKVVPITGIPLPFMSYGGTFLVVCLAGMGLVQSVWIHRKPFATAKAASTP